MKFLNFVVKFDIDCQGQSPQNNMIFTKIFHLIQIWWSKIEQVIELWCRQAENELMLTFELNWTLMSWPITPQNTSDLN